MYGNVERDEISSGYCYMNSHPVYKFNILKSLINYNYSDDMDVNSNLQNGDNNCEIGLINIHTLPQCNKSSNLNETNWGFKNSDVSGGHCYVNSHTASEANNNKSIYSTKKSD